MHYLVLIPGTVVVLLTVSDPADAAFYANIGYLVQLTKGTSS